MKEVTTKLYRYSELGEEAQETALMQYQDSFLIILPIEELYFTITGLLYPIFN